MATGELVKREKRNGIGILTLQDYGGLNILGSALLQDLGAALSSQEGDRDVRVVIITGERNFSSGADIREMKGKTPEEAAAFARLGQRVCGRIEDMGKAVIAAIGGYALGGGCEIALSCDIRIAAESARFGQPEITLGLIPGFGATQRLPRLIGMGRAKDLMLSGRVIDAREAESIGLVNNVVKSEGLMARAEEIALLIAQQSPRAVAMAKRLMNRGQEMRSGLEQEVLSFSECFTTEDHREGINAFLEKRPPNFRGR